MSRLEPILSANEIQALLDVADPRLRAGLALHAEPVDLLADDRHLRLLVPVLKVGYARVAEALRRVLTSVLRAKVEIRDEPAEILTGRGLVSVAEHAACLIVLKISTPEGGRNYGVLALDPLFAFSVIERLFGGGGGSPETPGERSPTALERRMLAKALQPLIDALNDNLEPPGYFHFQIHRIESRLDLVPGYTPDITSLHVPFTMTIGESLASLSLATPAAALEPLRKRVDPEGDGIPGGMATAMREVGVTVSVELGQVTLTLRQILNLSPGAVLTLNRHRSDDLPVHVEGVSKFSGVPVENDGAIAIEITGRRL